MQRPYIPAPDADFALWIDNFDTLLTASPTTYGLVAGDAVIVAAATAAFLLAFGIATNPATRTSPAIAAKDATRAAAEATIRPYAVDISRNLSVTNEDKLAIGVNLPNTARTPVPPPSTQPGLTLVSVQPGVQTIGFADVTTPFSKAKPAGAIGVQVFRAVGVVPAVDPAQSDYVATVTKSPFAMPTAPTDAGKITTYFARWVTRSGPSGIAQTGPYSAPLVAGAI